MNRPAKRTPPGRQHPLLADQERLDRIVKNMEITIQKVLYRRQLDEGEERALHGGVSSRDVLQEALVQLLLTDESSVTGTWEGLSYTIARRRAIDAVRAATKGRRAPTASEDEPDEITVVAFDAAIAEHTSAEAGETTDPERALMLNEQTRIIRRIARDLAEPVGCALSGTSRVNGMPVI